MTKNKSDITPDSPSTGSSTLRMVTQKKMVVEDKEAYAWSFEVFFVTFDFSTHAGIKPGQTL